jgi:hypothetical protein
MDAHRSERSGRQQALLLAGILLGALALVVGITLAMRARNQDTTEVIWHLASQPDGRVLHLTAMGGGCITGLDRVAVDETEEEVRVRVFVTTTGSRTCTADLGTVPADAHLSKPLGARKLMGECVPGDGSPKERICAALASFARPG